MGDTHIVGPLSFKGSVVGARAVVKADLRAGTVRLFLADDSVLEQ